MINPLKISKTVVSKQALLLASLDTKDIYMIEETDSHWFLDSSEHIEDEKVFEDFYRLCLEKEILLALEQSMAPMREILYKKAFEPIYSRSI